jgi:hypothetical protein
MVTKLKVRRSHPLPKVTSLRLTAWQADEYSGGWGVICGRKKH